MKNSLLAASAAIIIAGSAATYAIAQQPPAPPRPGMEDHWRPSPSDRAAFANARVAALHAGLTLTPEQEKLWPPVESVLKDMAQKREARIAQRMAEREKGGEKADKDRRPDAMERLRRGADFMTQTGADLKKLADAAQPLYDKLDDSQKHRLQRMLRHGMHERMHAGMRERAHRYFSDWRGHRDWRDDEGDRDGGPNMQDHGPDRHDDGSGERL